MDDIEEPGVSPYVDPPQEQFYSENVSNKLKEMYGDRSKLLKKITEIYKFIFKPVNKEVWKKTDSDINDDVMSAKYNLDLDRIVKESYAEILNNEKATLLLNKKTKMIPVLLDFCYIYYVTHFDPDVPFYKLPMTCNKYRLLANVLHAYGSEEYNNINGIFENIIENEFFKDLRIEEPPFYLRTEFSQDEIKEKLNIIVSPVCKELLTYLLKLKQKTQNINTESKNTSLNDSLNNSLNNSVDDSLNGDINDNLDSSLNNNSTDGSNTLSLKTKITMHYDDTSYKESINIDINSVD